MIRIKISLAQGFEADDELRRMPDFFIDLLPCVPQLGDLLNIGDFIDEKSEAFSGLSETGWNTILTSIWRVETVSWQKDSEGVFVVLYLTCRL